jgi:2-hydroxy-3-keto-5-methylthiopentenyl-1-phosphate phosphatase
MPQNTVVQCDFDGTVTYKDISFLLLDHYAGPAWRELWDQHQAGHITVGRFNELAFGMVKASREEMLDYVEGRFRLRPGLKELLSLCRVRGFHFVIVSNGLGFYIGHILARVGLPEIEHHGAEAEFSPLGVKVRYVDPEGRVLDSGFKDSYVTHFLGQGCRVAYIGNGSSDFEPARRCQRIFATDGLLDHCRLHNVDCIPFETFTEVAAALDTW